MKSNKSMMDLALAYAKTKGPRTITWKGKPTCAIYITKQEINDLHHAEGFTSDKVIDRRIKLWETMDRDSWYGTTGDFFILQIWDTRTRLEMEDYARRNLIEDLVGASSM